MVKHKDTNPHPLEIQILGEMHLITDIVDDRRIRLLMLDALSDNQLCGKVGSVSTVLMKTEPLQSAVELALVLNRPSDDTIAVLDDAKRHLQVRRAVLHNDWEAVLVHKSTSLELELAVQEARRRVVVEVLKRGLENGGVQGQPGQISTHHVSVALLSKGIARAIEIGTDTPDTRALLLSAHTVRQVRSGILLDSSEGGGNGRLDCPLVREALRSSEDHTLKELELVRMELQDQESAALLTSGIRTEDLMELGTAISSVPESHCHTVFTRALMKLCVLVKGLRVALHTQDWETAKELLNKYRTLDERMSDTSVVSSTQSQPDAIQWRAALTVVRPECESSKLLIDDAYTCSSLRNALGGDSDTLLKHAIESAVSESDEAVLLLKTATILLQVRHCILQTDFTTASVVLSEAAQFAGGSVSSLPVCGHELMNHEVTALNEICQGKLLNALSDKNSTSPLENALIMARQQIDKPTAETSSLAHSCNCVLQLRTILNRTDTKLWGYAQEVFSGFLKPTTNDMVPENTTLIFDFQIPDYSWCHKKVRCEIESLMNEIQLREAIKMLEQALSTGSAGFLGGFVDVATVKTGLLQAGISACKLVVKRTDELDNLQMSATIVLECREALLDGSWHTLEEVIRTASRCKIHGVALDELKQLDREVHLHSVIKQVLLQLQTASQERNILGMRAALKDAENLRLDSSPDLHVLSRVSQAQQLLEKLDAVDGRLRTGAQRHDLTMLQDALVEAETLKMEGSHSMNNAHAVRERLKAVTAQASHAIDTMDALLIRKLLEDQQRISVPKLPADMISEMHSLVSMAPMELERLKMNRAVERGDVASVIQATMAIKTRFFESEHNRERHQLHLFPGLRNARDFGAGSQNVRVAMQNSMLSHSSSPIAVSLTNLPSIPANALGIKLFRALLGYMGDRPYRYPATLAQEILQVGLAVAEIRDELYLQFAKQLTDNPSRESEQRGWVLLHMALQTFPPSELLENYFELWLRKQMRMSHDAVVRECVKGMHEIVFRGQAVTVPPLDPVYAILDIAR